MSEITHNEQRSYRVGIDVGTHSTGFLAVEVDDSDYPIQILNSVVFIHDSGVDPSAQKQAGTRRAVAGVARRTRRMYRRRKQRLAALDAWILEQGWPIVDLEEEENPYYPWLVRAELASQIEPDPKELARKLSVALRHMSRHRGWRNPYSPVRSLFLESQPSSQFEDFRTRVRAITASEIPLDSTPAQVVMKLGLHSGVKLRGPEGVLGGKLMQSDNANELRRIATVQGLSPDLVKHMITHVFRAESPRGSAAGRVGTDALPGQHHLRRAAKADESFQLFRIASVVANLRISDEGASRRLNSDEQQRVIEFLMYEGVRGDSPTWSDVAEILNVDRRDLRGTASQGPEGERASAFPPINVTDQRIRSVKIPSVEKWWEQADEDERAVFIAELSNAGDEVGSEEALEEVSRLIASLSDADVEKLSSISLPAGRAAYSRESLQRLTSRMLSEGLDLTAARAAEFGVAGDWLPPADPIGEPVGNPAVDRVTKQVARWLMAVTRQWGPPLSINIEHVRSGLGSEVQARELERADNRRFVRNQKVYSQMHSQLGLSGKSRRSDLMRFLAIQRQNGQCLYCGVPIDFETAEMDHIVPRAGEGGARNTRDNLVAVCERCNKSKSNMPFATWAEASGIPGVSVAEAVARVRHWIADPSESVADRQRLAKRVIERLRRTSADDPLDERSMESVAWMANELHLRVRHYYASLGTNTDVGVYRGSLTAEARKASGLENRVNLIGGHGKTRLDRRHHAVDAGVIALMRPSIAKTLAQRTNLRNSERATGAAETWKSFEGDSVASRTIYRRWREQMMQMTELLNLALSDNQIPVMQSLRLRLGNSRAHEDKIQKFEKRVLSAALSVTEIDRASTPALWAALVREPDFDPKEGLPANQQRSILVRGQSLGPLDTIELFRTSAACIAVRGGYAELGAAIHHARIYRISGKKPTFAMLRVYTVDLARHRNEDLFNVHLPVSSISVRTSTERLKKALEVGTAEYMGWLILGDEIDIDGSTFKSGHIGELLKAYPETTAWRVEGFPSNSRLRLRPALLSGEGVPENAPTAVREILSKGGWRPAANLIFQAKPVITRRTTLGKKRVVVDSGLPVTWSVEE